MSEERYEIRGKIGAGGVGAVYRAFDKNLNREVALKRVLPEGGHELQGEATRQLLKEASALSSIQHPHIVTVYDAGVDHDGPYVVMELISGRTIDSLIEQGTLTWEDFREVAVQTQEALIAAQDLSLVHRDLKPGNVMISWLPSGKFQIKIVDFGLAKFSAQPSLQTIDQGDAVFGSIFFMAPEQFERVPLDQRVDMYSMGALYYYCLTGEYPFTGDSAPLVMAAHLQHLVEPLHDKRPDIPDWAADWVMWHIERDRDNRPSSARQALETLLAYERRDREAAAAAAAAMNAAAGIPARPKMPFTPASPSGPVAITAPSDLAARASAPASESPMSSTTKLNRAMTTPQPLMPPEGARPSVHSSPLSRTSLTPPITHKTGPAGAVNPGTSATPAAAPTPATASTPVSFVPLPAVAVPAASAPVSDQAAAPASMAPATAAAKPGSIMPPRGPRPGAPAAAQPAAPAAAQPAVQPAGEPAGDAGAKPKPLEVVKAKWLGLKGPQRVAAIAAAAAIVVVPCIFIFGGDSPSATQGAQTGAQTGGRQTPPKPAGAKLSQAEASELLGAALAEASAAGRQKSLASLATATGDGWDLDEFLFKESLSRSMSAEARADLLTNVLAKRSYPAGVEPLLDFANREPETAAGKAAVLAATSSADGRHFARLLDLVTKQNSLSPNAESVLGEVVSKDKEPAQLARKIVAAYQSAPTNSARQAYIRLLGRTGDASAGEVVKTALKSNEETMRLAAIAALQNWPDEKLFPLLVEAAGSQESAVVRAKAFDAAISFLQANRERTSNAELWPALVKVADSDRQKRAIITGLVNDTGTWRNALLEQFATGTHSDAIKDLADRALKKIKEGN